MSTGMHTPKSDLRGGIGWMVFGLAVLGESLRMERFTSMGGTLYTMPGLVPGLFGGLLVVLGGALAWRSRRLMQAGDRGTADPLLNRRIATMLAITLAYSVGMIGHVPFVPATWLYVAAFTWLFAPPETGPVRRLLAALASGALTAAAIVLVFEQLFLVRLP
jgi:hypothetical protein